MAGGSLQSQPAIARGPLQQHNVLKTKKGVSHQHTHGKLQASLHKANKNSDKQHTLKHKQPVIPAKATSMVAATATVAVLAPSEPLKTAATAMSLVTAVARNATKAFEPSVPALYIRHINPTANQLKVGETIVYRLVVGNGEGTVADTRQAGIVVMNVVPLGLTHLKASGLNWQITLSDTIGPAVLTAKYTGTKPIDANTDLPPIFVIGTLTRDAEPAITSTATVDGLENQDTDKDITTTTLFVGAQKTEYLAAKATVIPTMHVIMTPVPHKIFAVPTPTPRILPVTPTRVAHPKVIPDKIRTPMLRPIPRATPYIKPEIHRRSGISLQATVTPVATAILNPHVTPTSIAVTTVLPKIVQAPLMSAHLRLVMARPDAPADNHYAIGQRANYVLSVSNMQGNENQVVSIVDIVAVGLSNITYTGSGWTIAASSTVGPAAIVATFNGPYPIVAGTTLPPITISGVITSAAGPLLSNASVVVSNDIVDAPENIIVDSFVVGATVPAEPTQTKLPVSTPVPSVMPTPVTPVSTVVLTHAGPPVGTAGTTPTTSVGPDLMLVHTNLYGDHATVGDKVDFVIVVAKTRAAEAIPNSKSISVDEVMPLGLRNLQATGKDWLITLSDTVSPAVMHAQYIGKIGSHSTINLAPIAITGELTNDALPILTSTAAVDIPGDPATDNNLASSTLLVQAAQPHNIQGVKPHVHSYARFEHDKTRRH
ncbi:hypothetical protein KDA_60250 [Dictyobacter alpinus]|uniref:DUF11 domain-containing protein n=1 Tax=Dictyobacter alpinus TaxID=2014873 RepID=A0A402BGK7_9CHLR|nr:hypothetical protein [Dictyobacter alpinus]GCE30541.1 hypothetical protein KDA_60250 [Dictyobacter alpinus]